MIANRGVTAKRRGAALFDGPQHEPLREREPMRLAIALGARAHDVGHLQRRARYRRGRRAAEHRSAASVSGNVQQVER